MLADSFRDGRLALRGNRRFHLSILTFSRM